MISLVGILLVSVAAILASNPPQTRRQRLVYAVIAVVACAGAALSIGMINKSEKIAAQKQKDCFRLLSQIVLESPRQKAEWITAILENKTSIFGDINYCSALDLVKAITSQEQKADN